MAVSWSGEGEEDFCYTLADRPVPSMSESNSIVIYLHVDIGYQLIRGYQVFRYACFRLN